MFDWKSGQLFATIFVAVLFMIGGLYGLAEFVGILLGMDTDEAWAFLLVAGLFSTTTLIVILIVAESNGGHGIESLSHFLLDGLTPIIGFGVGVVLSVKQAVNFQLPDGATFEAGSIWALTVLFIGAIGGSISLGAIKFTENVLYFLKRS